MKRNIFTLLFTGLALLAVSCEKESVEHTGDQSGTLYGYWSLDTKTVDILSNAGGNNGTNHDETDFRGDNFLLYLTDFQVAFGQEGTLLTFDIDDVDGVTYSYNADKQQITFHKPIVLSKGFLSVKIMQLYGTYDITELTDKNMTLKKEETIALGSLSSTQTTVYQFHKLSEKSSAK